MKYNKNKVGLLTFTMLIGVVVLPKSIFALEITEIMYDLPGTDSDREWIEVRNNLPEVISLTDYKFFENSVGHTINAVEGYSGFLQQGDYAVIADNPQKFLEDTVGYEGSLFQSSFSLSNTGEKLGIVNKQGEIISEVEYASSLGAKGTGNSLQWFEGVFIEGVPTPGAENVKTIAITQVDNTNEDNVVVNNDVSTHESQITLSTSALEKTIYIDIGRERSVIVGNTVSFEAAAAGQGSRKKITYIWNFGDGTIKKGRKVTHNYKHKGHYNVVVNAIAGTSRAVARTTVAVSESNVALSVGDEGLYVVNNALNEINIGGFYVKHGRESYTFPQDTIISAQSAIIFSWQTLGFSKDEIKNREANMEFALHRHDKQLVVDTAQ